MKVDITPEQEQLVNDWIVTEAYQSAQEVLDHALECLEEDAIVASYDQEALRESLRQAKADLDQGNGSRWDVNDFIARGEKRRAEGLRKKAHP